MPWLLFPIPGAFDSVGSTELQNAGKAGLVTVQGTISAVLGTVLICKFLCSYTLMNTCVVVLVLEMIFTCYFYLIKCQVHTYSSLSSPIKPRRYSKFSKPPSLHKMLTFIRKFCTSLQPHQVI